MGVWTAAAVCTAWSCCKERDAPGQQDSSVRATPGLWQSEVFLVQSHLLPIWLGSPAVSLEQWQESLAPSTLNCRLPKVPCARSEQPGQHPCPAPCHLPSAATPHARPGAGAGRRHRSPSRARAWGGICGDYAGGITKEQTFPQTLQSLP